MQSVFAKESEVLTKNIGSEPLRRNNVVLSHENLKMIAVLHESMVSSEGKGKGEMEGGKEKKRGREIKGERVGDCGQWYVRRL